MRGIAFFTVFTVVVLASCVNEKNLYEGVIPDVPLENYKMTTDFDVPVKDGYKTIVTYDGEVIFEGNYPATIQVPKFSTNLTRSTGLDWHFEVYDSSDYDLKKYITGILMFEDIVDGDNDYNDFVCYVDIKIHSEMTSQGELTRIHIPNFKVTTHAMGNLLPLKFGIEIINKATGEYIDDIIYFEDIRKECYDGIVGFINTVEDGVKVKNKKHENWPAKDYRDGKLPLPKMDINNLAINFYIVVNGAKHYTADSDKKLATSNNTPYGLFIPNKKNFKYPKETISIFKAYPNFGDWLKGGASNPFVSPNNELLY